jgi:hypothetical protein
MRTIFFVLAALLLTSCATTEAQRQVAAAQEILTCNEMGARTQEQLFQCRMMLQQNAANAEIQRRQASGQLGAMISAQNQPRPNDHHHLQSCRAICCLQPFLACPLTRNSKL